ncbi:hypothetical protein ACRS6B_06490 [Nocardia asteroides]
MLNVTEDFADERPDVAATRAAYDDIAETYTELFRHHLAGAVLDRAMLGAFVESVLGNGSGPVADLGCGPGRITGHLASLGARVFGMISRREWWNWLARNIHSCPSRKVPWKSYR